MLVGGTLTGTQHPPYVQLGGYQLLTDLVSSHHQNVSESQCKGVSKTRHMGSPDGMFSLSCLKSQTGIAVLVVYWLFDPFHLSSDHHQGHLVAGMIVMLYQMLHNA